MAEQAAAPITSIDDLLAQPDAPRRETARISLRWDLVEKHRDAIRALDEARRHDESSNWPVDQHQAPAAAEHVQAVEAELRASEVEFVFESIGEQAWKKLLAENPPMAEHRKMGLDHDPRRFPRVAIAASCVQPTGMTTDKIDALRDRKGMTIELFDRLWGACLAANMSGERPGESSAASAVLQRSRPSSEQPEATGSLEAS